MMNPVARDTDGLLTDDELSARVLAADPDMAVDDNAVSLWDRNGSEVMHLLPEW